ncbi:Short chain dehydrogenase [Burkholderia sp. AU4i]|nr:Short chain dehydrogenase [Burkholderia sp. AU4i]
MTIASRDAARLAASKDRIGYGVSTGVMDITDDASVRAFLDSAGEFDHVVVSAAQTATGPVRGLELDDAYAAMDSKFWGAYRIARAVRIRQGGSLTFVSGFLSVRPSKNSVLQGAINAALESLARGLALELAPVRVNTVSPGLIATPLWSKIDAEARDRMYEGAAARLPAGRVGQPEDVANAVLYLASTPYATGSTVLVDGGGAIA